MASTIKIKNSSTAGAAPTASDLVQGELAVNVTDKRIYTENASGTVVELGTNPSVPVTFPDGSASAPSLTNDGDTNTGVFFPAADAVGVTTGGTERVRVDSSGNVGIGTSSPLAKLSIGSGSIADANVPIQMNAVASTGSAFIGFNNAGGYGLLVGYDNTVGYARVRNIANTAIAFSTNDTERMRIDSSGNLLVGTTSAQAKITTFTGSNANAARLYVNSASSTATAALILDKYDNNSTTSQVFAQFTFNQQTGACGQINANGANQAAFGTFSDSRLKENIVDLPPQLSNIMALRPVEYDYIQSEGGGHQIGFVAQEVQEIYPDLVGERSDGMLTLTDFNKNDARLIKAIQEQQALITQLQADVAALKGQA